MTWEGTGWGNMPSEETGFPSGMIEHYDEEGTFRARCSDLGQARRHFVDEARRPAELAA